LSKPRPEDLLPGDRSWISGNEPCRRYPYLFIGPSPTKGDNRQQESSEERKRREARAKDLCWGECGVREQCLGYALDEGEKIGIWGGMTMSERNQLVARRVRARQND